jgi:hypothetical protein
MEGGVFRLEELDPYNMYEGDIIGSCPGDFSDINICHDFDVTDPTSGTNISVESW